jgi:hypothetical protein
MNTSTSKYDIYAGVSSDATNFNIFGTFGFANTSVSPGLYASADTFDNANECFLNAIFKDGFEFAFIINNETNETIKTSIGLKEKLENEYKKTTETKITLPVLELHKSENWIRDSRVNFGSGCDPKYFGGSFESNQLIPNNILIVGAYPTRNNIEILRGLGVTVYCCLNDEYGKCIKWDMYDEYEKYLNRDEQFIHQPIQDMSTIGDKIIDDLSDRLVALILDGKKVYLHCGGGHGRAGMVACVTLHKLYPELSEEQIMNYVQFTHDQRTGKFFTANFAKYIEDPVLADCFVAGQVPSPQTSKQRDLVSRLIRNNNERIEARKNYDEDVYLQQQQINFDEWFAKMKHYDAEEKAFNEHLEFVSILDMALDAETEADELEEVEATAKASSEATSEEEKEEAFPIEGSVLTFSISRKVGGK